MENNYERMRMPELKALAKRNGSRGYSRLRKADLIRFINESLREDEPQPAIDELTIEQPQNVNILSKRQRKRNAQKAAKLKKKSNNLRNEINELKSQMDVIGEKIKKASNSAGYMFKGKKIRSMKREATKLSERTQKLMNELKSIEESPMSKTMSQTMSQQSKENRRIKRKIEDIKRKIRRAKGKTKRNLLIKRDLLRSQLSSTTPRLIEGAFGGNYSKYRINGIEGMDLSTFFSKLRNPISSVLRKETSQRAIRSQTTTWIRFVKGVEYVSLAFNSRMTPVYMLNDIDSIVQSMINHMSQQVENPALRDSKFVFDGIMHTDISIHRLNLTRGSGYIPLPDWLASKKAIINPKNLDMKCFKWSVIAGLKWEETDRDHQRVSKLRRYENEFDWSGISYPVSTKDISKFELRNRIGVNLLALNGKTLYSCRKGMDYERTVNLMIIEDGEKKTLCSDKVVRKAIIYAE